MVITLTIEDGGDHMGTDMDIVMVTDMAMDMVTDVDIDMGIMRVEELDMSPVVDQAHYLLHKATFIKTGQME